MSFNFYLFTFAGGTSLVAQMVKCLPAMWDTQVQSLGWKRKWQPTPVLLPGKFPGWRSLVGYSPWGSKERDMTERLHFHFSLSCIGKQMATHSVFLPGESQRWGAWWAAVYGVAEIGHDANSLSMVLGSFLISFFYV